MKILLSLFSISIVIELYLAKNITKNETESEIETNTRSTSETENPNSTISFDVHDVQNVYLNKYTKYIAFYGHYFKKPENQGCGVIIKDDLVLTNYALYMVSEMIFEDNEGNEEVLYNTFGYVIGGKNTTKWNPKIMRPYFKVRNMNVIRKVPETVPQLGLIILKNKLQLNTEVNAIPLARENYTAGALCYVLSWGVKFKYSTLKVREIKILSNCSYKGVFCFYEYKTAELVESCVYDGGEPVICNDKLAGIVNYNDVCIDRLPRTATSIYENLKWLEQEMFAISEEGKSNAPIVMQCKKLSIFFTFVFCLITYCNYIFLI